MIGVTNVVDPDCKRVPPVGALYQSIVDPAGGVALILTVPAEHLALFTATGNEGKAFTVNVSLCRPEDTHPVIIFLDWA
jgi:hypothetical protein